MKIETQKLLKIFGTQEKLAEFFSNPESKCTQQAVQQWGEFIPRMRMYELRLRRPDIFDDITNGKYD